MSESIFDDPVVAEIHATRAKMLADCGGDIERLMRQVAARQHASDHPVITTPFRNRGESPAPGAGFVSDQPPIPPAR